VHVRLAANISLLFHELPYLERPAAAAAAGFEAIETWWPFGDNPTPAVSEIDAVLGVIERSGVELVACNFFAGDMPAGERGVLSLPDRIDDFRSSIGTLVRISVTTGCSLFNALYGVRNERFATEAQDVIAVENLRYAADALNGTVLIEALAEGENGAYPLTSPDDVQRVIAASGVDNVAMLADFYHFDRNGFDFGDVIPSHLPEIAHMQIADSPGRHEPGTGAIDFASLFELIGTSGYSGWVSAEYRPEGATVAGLGWVDDLGLDLRGWAVA
jgi:hydroxypyruvate isomerase